MNFPAFITLAGAMCGGALALGALLRARRTLSHWAFFVGMVALTAEALCLQRVVGASSPERIVYWRQWGFLALCPLPGAWLLFSLTYARGNAREFLRRWRLILAGTLVLPIVLAAFFRGRFLAPHEDVEHQRWTLVLGPPGVAFYLCLLVGSVLVLMNLERTFRASVGTVRWRIKFMLLGVGVLFVTRVYTTSQALLFNSLDPNLEILNSVATVAATLLILRTVSRAGHLGVDVYPSQSVLQSSLTVLLAGVYLVMVGVLAKVVAWLGGDSAFALEALVVLFGLVLLAVLLQSDRARLGLRRFVSRHFQRPLYDYRTAWKKFTEGTASCVTQKELGQSLDRLIAEMFQVLSVNIWLADERKDSLSLAASTSVAEGAVGANARRGAEAAEVISHFHHQHEPVEIETSAEPWAVALRRWHPSEFPNGGSRVCVPLNGRGDFLGLIIMGDRVGGVPFSLQDFDLLKCVGDHAAASLLNIQLSERLLQARELEAFQTMAAFFVHDLKNAGSTLGLMLQNLPVHFDDPEFRQDTLRGIAKTAGHINRLIGRLSLLRHELKIRPVESDLNAMVTQAVAGLESENGTALVKELQPLPKLHFDPEQMHKVVTNLVLNALEAIPAGGHVRLGTSQSGRTAVLSVADDGCGMSEDFLNRSLFRPFQTTKKTGLGIGMFQSRMIVEAHGGKIAVASSPGLGTTFRVSLPLPPEVR